MDLEESVLKRKHKTQRVAPRRQPPSLRSWDRASERAVALADDFHPGLEDKTRRRNGWSQVLLIAPKGGARWEDNRTNGRTTGCLEAFPSPARAPEGAH